MIKLESLDHTEALRYLGMQGKTPDAATARLLEDCEKELLAAAKPAYIYRCFESTHTPGGMALANCGLLLTGKEIYSHLEGCEKAVLLCATISAGIDGLIRKAQVEDMAKAVVLDALASVAVEQLCQKLEEQIGCDFAQYYKTWRFSPGYGDLPVTLQRDFLNVLDAPRKIGVCTNESCMLTPAKSVTAVVGLSREEIKKKRRSCTDCTLRERCAFRKAGERCV